MMSNDQPARGKPEDELLHSTAALRSLPNGVVICDRAGIVRFINPAGTRLLGVDIEQWLNRPLANLPHGAALSDSAVGQIAKIRVEGEWLNYRVVPVWSSKHPTQQIGRLVLFDERLSRQEASQYLLAVISHELRTPLTAIIGNTELLVRELLGPISPDQRDALNSVAKRSLFMRDVINDVMTLSSIENGTGLVDDMQVSLMSVLQELLPLFEQRLRDDNIDLLISVPNDLSPIAADSHAVRDILRKLIDNACHYTSPNGQIQVRAERVSRQIRVDIVDTGIGISDAAKPHIFADFVHDYFNPLSSQIHYFHGVGMSLVIVRKLVELYGGNIWFESTVGQGSTFSFTLPISESV